MLSASECHHAKEVVPEGSVRVGPIELNVLMMPRVFKMVFMLGMYDNDVHLRRLFAKFTKRFADECSTFLKAMSENAALDKREKSTSSSLKTSLKT